MTAVPYWKWIKHLCISYADDDIENFHESNYDMINLMIRIMMMMTAKTTMTMLMMMMMMMMMTIITIMTYKYCHNFNYWWWLLQILIQAINDTESMQISNKGSILRLLIKDYHSFRIHFLGAL